MLYKILIKILGSQLKLSAEEDWMVVMDSFIRVIISIWMLCAERDDFIFYLLLFLLYYY